MYNNMRVQLSLLIRELEEIRLASVDESPVMSLDHLRMAMHEHCDIFNARMATAMTDGRMSGELAISLLNDSNYGQEIFGKLVDVAETLFVRHSRSLTEAEREVMLSDDELEALED